ncbi:DUF4333 domain-containing protein [Nocardia sp. XZ_19_385]|uniref:DUF4333 domain-containing protein n=1 Tax=Nocardia sp. XZ_19_385 TaxID=2769488 RepID=UPI00188F9529|nr:DUF4333 domain-containing protein [Nocardia sp. XZ_19_385]
MKATLVTAVPVLLLLVAGCTYTPTIEEADLEKSVQQTLSEKVGRKPDSVDCPGDLKGNVGTTMRCTLTTEGTQLGLTVKVTAVIDQKVEYEVEVDQA